MNIHPLETEISAQQAREETAGLTQAGFAQSEITSLLRLREWYQNGGSDRVNVVRHWQFLKFLVMNGKLDA
jgi:hypothetical protein